MRVGYDSPTAASVTLAIERYFGESDSAKVLEITKGIVRWWDDEEDSSTSSSNNNLGDDEDILLPPTFNISNCMQGEFTPEKGNALQACVASIFCKNMTSVPNFISNTNKNGKHIPYKEGIKTFVNSIGYDCTKIELYGSGVKGGVDLLPYYNSVCLLRGKSPRGEHGHVVVARITSSQPSFEMVSFCNNGVWDRD